jgi:hypothetical protein
MIVSEGGGKTNNASFIAMECHLSKELTLNAIWTSRHARAQRDRFWAFRNTNAPPVRNIRAFKKLKLKQVAIRCSEQAIFHGCVNGG